MNKQEITERLAELRKILEQIQANGNATLGAIAECEYWLKKFDEAGEDVKALPQDKTWRIVNDATIT